MKLALPRLRRGTVGFAGNVHAAITDWTAKQDVAVAAYQAGVPVRAIAEMYEISTTCVQQLAERAGVPQR